MAQTVQIKVWLPWTLQPRVAPPAFGQVAVECEGRTFGSWIGSRGGFSDGDLITNPVYMIEDILRNILGVPTARIDTASFDAQQGFSGRLFINSDYSTDALVLCDWLAAQGGGILARSGGIYRFIDLGVVTPSSDFILRWDEVVDVPFIERTSVNEIINRLTIKHAFQPQHGTFARTDIFENATSKTKNGGQFRNAEIQCPNIDATAVASLGSMLVSSSSGIWAKTHIRVRVQLAGYKYANVQSGDFFSLDDNTFDSHILPAGGTTWGSGGLALVMLVERVQPTVDGVIIQGVTIND